MSYAHQNIKDKVEATLHKSSLDENLKDEIRSGVDQTISESLSAERAGTKIDWQSILTEVLALIEAYIASANTAPPIPTPPASSKAKNPKSNF